MTARNENAQEVVIVGGGFCGATVARRLDGRAEVNVTLVDRRDRLEYIPGIPRIPFSKRAEEKLALPYRDFLKRVRILHEEVTAVTPDAVMAGGERLPFDTCVICPGAMYPVFLDNRRGVFTLASVEDARRIGKAMADARRILIVGGGTVGTEFAAELAIRTPDRSVTVVHGMERLLERNPPRASEYARRFLESRGVEIFLNDLVVRHEGEEFETKSGRRIAAGLAVWCGGIRPTPPEMEGFDDGILNDRKALRVNASLQLQGYPNIYVGGDVTDVEEEKTAQNAEGHAAVIAGNILRRAAGKPLSEYKPRSGPLVISLGPTCGIMTWKSHTLRGILPGLLKWVVEAAILFQFRPR